MQKDLENLAKEMQMVLSQSSREYYFHRLTCRRDDYRWGIYNHTLNENILIADLRDSLVGYPPFTRDDILAKQQLAKKGVRAFIMAPDKEVEEFRKTIRREPFPKIKTRLFQLFSHRQNIARTHE